MIKLAISGAHGRMGETIANLALKNNAFEITALLEHKDHPKASESLKSISVSPDNNTIAGSDILIEFTLPEGTMDNLAACVEHNVHMVIGTTGLSEAQESTIKKASENIAIVFSNMAKIKRLYLPWGKRVRLVLGDFDTN